MFNTSSKIFSTIVPVYFVVLAAGCGRKDFDSSGGDFSKAEITKAATSYKQGAEEPSFVPGSVVAFRSQAQSTTFLRMTLSAELVQTATEMALEVNGTDVLSAEIKNTEDDGFSFFGQSSGDWILTVFPGSPAIAPYFPTGLVDATFRLIEPRFADSGEPVTFTRTGDVVLTVVDFDVLGAALSSFPGDVSTSDNGGFQGWTSVYANPAVGEAVDGYVDYLNSDVANILFESNF